jgi:2'-5' RNA ligase
MEDSVAGTPAKPGIYSIICLQKLRKIWKKKGYKDFKPHITLYNGTDEVFAKKLFERLQQNFKSKRCVFHQILNRISSIRQNTIFAINRRNRGFCCWNAC